MITAFPVSCVETFDMLVSPGRVRMQRQRFPRLTTRRTFRVTYGPTTLADLETSVLSVIRATKFTAETTIALPNVGTITGHYVGDSIDYEYASPTNVSMSIEFREVPR